MGLGSVKIIKFAEYESNGPSPIEEIRHKSKFIQEVHYIESYANIDDVPKKLLQDFREKYFGTPYHRENECVKPVWRVNELLQPFFTKRERIYRTYQDIVNGIPIEQACKNNHVSSLTLRRHHILVKSLVYTDQRTMNKITASSFEEMIKQLKRLRMNAPITAKRLSFYLNKHHGNCFVNGRFVGTIERNYFIRRVVKTNVLPKSEM